jgi:hypothetical protein
MRYGDYPRFANSGQGPFFRLDLLSHLYGVCLPNCMHAQAQACESWVHGTAAAGTVTKYS